MIVAAFDLSLTASGFAISTNGIITASGLIPGKFTDVERMCWVRNRVMDKVDDTKPDLVVIEDLANSRNMAYAKENAGLSYMIRAELWTDKKPYLLVAANQLKKYCVGSGGSSKTPVKKEHVMLQLFKRFGHETTSNDEADALVLAHLGMAIVGDEQPTIDPQREVLTALKAKNKWLASLSAGGQTPAAVDAGW